MIMVKDEFCYFIFFSSAIKMLVDLIVSVSEFTYLLFFDSV